jgi:hypothetical protein
MITIRLEKYRNDYKSRNGVRWSWWNKAVDKYGWKIEHEIDFKRGFGIYSLI